MTDLHNSITPPPELVEDWIEIAKPLPQRPPNPGELATLAARWGANQELEACCDYLTRCASWEPEDVQEMRDLLHPKPPSLKEQALAALDDAVMRGDCITTSDALPAIRRALEQLND
jgi:hypothetical protein